MRRLVSLFVLPIMTLGLAGCPPLPPPTEYDPISFTDKRPIALDVAEIRIEVLYDEPLTPPHVGQEFPVPPVVAARQWAEERLRAVGRSGIATVTIREAGATETDLERSTGLKGLLNKEQSQRYDVTISMTVVASTKDNSRRATVEATASRFVTVLEDADINEREAAWYQLTKDTVDRFDTVMTAEIYKTMGEFIR